MKIFHYSRLEDWRDIQHGSWKSKDEPGLGASRRMGREDTEAFSTGAVFGLLEARPENWVANKDFKEVWSYLKGDVGPLLLEIDADPEKDNVFIVDRGHIEGFLYGEVQSVPQRYQHETRREGERAYMESKIPLKQYLEKPEEYGYSLPEVVFPENVPIEKIRISEQQPDLESELGRYKGDLRRSLVRQIEDIPELADWYRSFEDERRHSEGSEMRIGKG